VFADGWRDVILDPLLRLVFRELVAVNRVLGFGVIPFTLDGGAAAQRGVNWSVLMNLYFRSCQAR
jgi:hypothetical protein